MREAGFEQAVHTRLRLHWICRLPAQPRAGYALVVVPAALSGTSPRRLPGAHPDRERRWPAHQPFVGRLEQALVLVQVDGPPDATYAIPEQAVGVSVPVGRPYTFPCRWPKVIGHDAPDLAVPCAKIFGLGQLGRDRGHEEADDGDPEQAA